MKSWELSDAGDVIDTRDIAHRIDELESWKADLEQAQTEVDLLDEETDDPDDIADAHEALRWAEATFGDDEQEELDTLTECVDELPFPASHGLTLIYEHYFETYAQQYAEDIGAINVDMTWPATCIDWEQAAAELQMDFTPVELGGNTYYTNG